MKYIIKMWLMIAFLTTPLVANSACLEAVRGYGDYSSPGVNVDNLPRVWAKFASSSVIEVKQLSNNFSGYQWGEYDGLVLTNATCIVIGEVGGQNSYFSTISEPPQEPWSGYLKLMKCEEDRAVGSYSPTRDPTNPDIGMKAAIFTPTDPPSTWNYYSEIFDLNEYVEPGTLYSSGGYESILVRADDIQNDRVLVWSGWPLNITTNDAATYRYTLYLMNLNECSSTPQPQLVNVPNYVGMTRQIAEASIIQDGLNIGAIIEEYNSQPAGIIFNQIPPSGTEVVEGSFISLYVSLGSQPTQNLPTIFVEAEDFTTQFGVVAECGYPSANGGCNLGYIREGDWSEYNIDFQSGNADIQYNIRIRYAVWSTSSPRYLTIDSPPGEVGCGGVTVNLPVTDTSSVSGWETIEIEYYPLTCAINGINDIRFTYHGGSMNIDSFEFIPMP